MNYITKLREMLDYLGESETASKLGISTGHLRKLLKGKKDFTIDILRRIAEIELYVVDGRYPKTKILLNYIVNNLDEIEYRAGELIPIIVNR
jgi:transcriptional regulator with XRE-family HTH domain